MSETRFTVYGDARSGNCYKVALLLRLLGRPFDWVEVDVMEGTTRQPWFLEMNPNGRVPLLTLPDGRHLSESNAILLHLAEGTSLLPAETYPRALVYQWLFFEQYSHEPYIAVARFLRHFDHGQPLDPARMTMLQERGTQALGVMESALSGNRYFAGDHYSVADIALFAYTHVAGDGGFDLQPYQRVCEWLDRVRSRPGHFDMVEFSR